MYGADGTKDVKKDKKSGSNAMLYGAGGLAAGAVGGALIANAMGKSLLPDPSLLLYTISPPT